MTDFEADPDYEDCLVTFIDILGFRNLLNTKSGAEIRQALSTFRRQVSPGPDPARVSRSDEVRLQSEVRAEIVSDAIVRVRTTETQYRDGTLVWELIDLLHIQIDLINDGILARAAMAMGPMHLGADLGGPVFGPGLVQAYEMEGREVIYPRIAIHEDVIERHRTDWRLWREDHDYEEEKRHLDRLLRQDEAGLYFIDYLKAGYYEFDTGADDWLGFMQDHKALIVEGLETSPNASVRRKYVWLKNYHNSVLDEAERYVKPDDTIEGDLPLSALLSECRIAD